MAPFSSLFWHLQAIWCVLSQTVCKKPTHTNLSLNSMSHHHHHQSNRQAVFSTMVLRPRPLYIHGIFHDELDFLNTTTATDIAQALNSPERAAPPRLSIFCCSSALMEDYQLLLSCKAWPRLEDTGCIHAVYPVDVVKLALGRLIFLLRPVSKATISIINFIVKTSEVW